MNVEFWKSLTGKVTSTASRQVAPRSRATVYVVALLACGAGSVQAQTSPSQPTAAPATAAPIASLDASIRKQVVENLVQKLSDDYAVADVGAKMAQTVRSKLEAGAYDRIVVPEDFARALHADIRGAMDDKHLRVTFEATPQPAPPPMRPPGGKPGPADVPPAVPPEMRKLNGAIRRAQILPGNIGYLEINGVPPLANEAIDAAFAFLRNTDALILDLRGNGGGSPETVAYYMSYLSEGEPYPVIRVQTRHNGVTETRTTNLGNRSYGASKPVYVLTSYMTFSGGEELAYDVQSFKRGLIVGETTGGGANPGGPQPLGFGFTVFLPFGYVVHPVTGANWEGVGVKPDVHVDASLALLEAQRLAAERLRQSATDSKDRLSLEMLAASLAQEQKHAATAASASLKKSQAQLPGFYAPVGGAGPSYAIVEKDGALVLQPTSVKPPSRLVHLGNNRYQLGGLPEGVTAVFTTTPAGKTQMLLQQAHWLSPLVLEKR